MTAKKRVVTRGRIPIRPLSAAEEEAVEMMHAYDAIVRARAALSSGSLAPHFAASLVSLDAGAAAAGIRPLVSGPVFIPVSTASELNRRATVFLDRHRRSKEMRQTAPLILRTSLRPRPRAPARVTLTRVEPRSLDQGNLQGALKAAQDAVATDFLGVDDGDPRLLFVYEQRPSAGRAPGVEVRIEWGFLREQCAT